MENTLQTLQNLLNDWKLVNQKYSEVSSQLLVEISNIKNNSNDTNIYKLQNLLFAYRPPIYILKTIQSNIDYIVLKDILNKLNKFIINGNDIEISASYDDETGYYPRLISWGPLTFTDEGEYVWNNSEVFALAEADFNLFKEFVSIFNYQYEIEDRSFFSNEALVLLDNFKNSSELMENNDDYSSSDFTFAIPEICFNINEPLIQGMGSSVLLSELFEIIIRAIENKAPLSDDTESFPIEWVIDRCR